MSAIIHPWQQLAAGEQWRGWWEPGIPSVSALPVLAVRGLQPGPQVVITGGIHGDEYEGPAAIHAFFNTLPAAEVTGTVIGLPVVNGAAWQARARVAPSDHLDLNRVFPGQAGASEPTRALAAALFDTFIRPCDLLIDLHSGGVKLVHLPMVGWYAGGPQAETLARDFGEAVLPWMIPDVPGVLSYEAHRLGKIAIGAEWGGGARLDPNGVAGYVAGLRRILAQLAGGITQSPTPDTRRPIAGSYQSVEGGGLFVASVNLGDHVTPASTLGRLYNLLGEPISEIKAARNGIVAALAHLAWLEAGDRVAYVG
jgi:hypothetical protein